jgi:cysteine synthase A
VASLPNIKDIIMIPEPDTIRMCHAVHERYGLRLGGSTGTVLCGVQRYQKHLPTSATVVAISPDMGERYAATVYNPEWVFKTFGIQL